MQRDKTLIATFARQAHAMAHLQLGFTLWITLSATASAVELRLLRQRIDDHLLALGLRGVGGPLHWLVRADDRHLGADDQVGLLLWAAGLGLVREVAMGPLVPLSRTPAEHGSQPVVLARSSDLALIPISWLFHARRLPATQVIDMLGGYRSTATVH